MENHKPNSELPPIPPPPRRFSPMGEVRELGGVKAHVLRYWEQEFTQLKPVKRRGNRRYYQHHEVLLIRRIRQLLYEDGFTISGARSRLDQNATSQEESLPNIHGNFNAAAIKHELREIISLLRA